MVNGLSSKSKQKQTSSQTSTKPEPISENHVVETRKTTTNANQSQSNPTSDVNKQPKCVKMRPKVEQARFDALEPQEIPTPELLRLRRASLHVPMPLASGSASSSEGNLHTLIPPPRARRATLSMRDLLEVVPNEIDFKGLTSARSRRGSACLVPSKLTVNSSP